MQPYTCKAKRNKVILEEAIQGGSMQEIHPELLKRKIIHIDMDAFYASVEILDNPGLVGLPIIIGSSPKSRGVVCTASYEARKFGVRSAMSCAAAYRLCPQGIFIQPRHRRYTEVSNLIFKIFERFSTRIESVSLDEAYLDVTDECRSTPASVTALEIKNSILTEIGLTSSAGVAPNKMLAKLASEIEKPNGLTVIKPHEVLDFMKNLPVRKLNGIGPVTAEKLSSHGIIVCSDLYKFRKLDLYQKLGARLTEWLWDSCLGIHREKVVHNHEQKSLGSENTFEKNLFSPVELEQELQLIANDVFERLQNRCLLASNLTLKIKYDNFVQETRSASLPTPFLTSEQIFQYALLLLNRGYHRPVRLLGISLSRLEERRGETLKIQVPLFDHPL
jgi:DNA polymerase-4